MNDGDEGESFLENEWILWADENAGDFLNTNRDACRCSKLEETFSKDDKITIRITGMVDGTVLQIPVNRWCVHITKKTTPKESNC